MTKYSLDESQRAALEEIGTLHAKMERQRHTLAHNKAVLDLLITKAMKRGISTGRIGKAAGLTPSRVFQIAKKEDHDG